MSYLCHSESYENDRYDSKSESLETDKHDLSADTNDTSKSVMEVEVKWFHQAGDSTNKKQKGLLKVRR